MTPQAEYRKTALDALEGACEKAETVRPSVAASWHITALQAAADRYARRCIAHELMVISGGLNDDDPAIASIDDRLAAIRAELEPSVLQLPEAEQTRIYKRAADESAKAQAETLEQYEQAKREGE